MLLPASSREQRSPPSGNSEQVSPTIVDYLPNREAVAQYLTDWLEHGERMGQDRLEHSSHARIRMQQLR